MSPKRALTLDSRDLQFASSPNKAVLRIVRGPIKVDCANQASSVGQLRHGRQTSARGMSERKKLFCPTLALIRHPGWPSERLLPDWFVFPATAISARVRKIT